MQTQDCPGNARRFDYVTETMKAFIGEAAKWDPDGVSFYAFNNHLQAFPNVTTVDEISSKIASLRPGGGTNTHLAITAAYKEHKEAKSEQTFLMIFTDGEPTDPDAVKKSIIDITKDVTDEKEFRICILTVGQRSAALETWLNDLDNNLTGVKYDIVKVEKLEDVDFEQAVADAIEG
jgi:Mg-chelatase subunit ChlD